MGDSVWQARKIARRNLEIVLGVYAFGVYITNVAYDDLGVFSAIRPVASIMTTLCAMLFILEQKLTRFTVSEDSLQFLFFMLFGAVTLVASSYFLINVVDIVYFGSSLKGTFDIITRERMLLGSLPPELKLAAVMPLQAIPAGMDIKVAKRLAAATVAISLLVLYFMCQTSLTPNPADHSCEMNDADFRRKAMIYDVLLYAYCISLAYFSMAPGLQMGDELTKTLRAGRLADSVLNHILKNSVAGAACLIEIEIEDMPESNDRLTAALEQLHRAMQWCVSRQVMVDLLAHSYKSVLSPCNINRFLARMVQASTGKGSFVVVKENLETTDRGAAGDREEEEEFHLDVHMAEVAIANALSNAVAHGDTNEAVELSSRLKDSNGQHFVVLKVENHIPKEAEGQLTDEILDEIRVDAILKDSASKGSEPTKRTTKVSSSISTNSGMHHIHLACHGAGGSFDMKLGSKNGRTTVILEVSLPVQQGASSKDQGAVEQKYSCVDSTSAHLASSHEPIPEGLKICAIDDSKILCKGYERLVLPKLKADKATSCVVCPVSSSCIDRFMNEAIGAGSADDKENRPADILILDQHIAFTDSASVQTHHVLGTKLAKDLRNRSFTGLILIRSANSTKEDVAAYLRTGSVDGCLGKDHGSKELVADICAAFRQKREGNATPLGLQQQYSQSSGASLEEDFSSDLFAAGASFHSTSN